MAPLSPNTCLQKEVEMAEASAAVSDDEIATIITYMDPNSDGVSKDEFEEAFRAGRRLYATAKAEEEGKKLFAKLLETLGDKSPAQWFAESNTDAMGDDDDDDGEEEEETPSLDAGEFLDALKKLGFRKKQTKYLKDYLDPDGSGDIDINGEATPKLLPKPCYSNHDILYCRRVQR